MVRIAFGFDARFVPGRDAEVAVLGVDRPEAPVRADAHPAMSSPTVQTFQPSKRLGGIIIAKFVLPQALGNAAAT